MALAGQRARLEPGVALPRAALRDQVLLERGERHRQRAALAVGAQPHVDAEDVAVRGDVVERADDAPAEPVEELAVGKAARAVGLAFLRVDEDEVDVGRDVELAAAELAHADDDQALHRAGGVARLAVRRGQRRVVERVRRSDGDLGEPGDVGADLEQVGAAGEVADQRLQHHPPSQPAQRPGERRGVALRDRGVDCARDRPPVERRVDDRIEPGTLVGVRGQRSAGVAAVGKGGADVHRVQGAGRVQFCAPGDREAAGRTDGADPGLPLQCAQRPSLCPVGARRRSSRPQPETALLRLARIAGVTLIAVFAVFALALLAVRFVVFPRVESHRDDLAALIARELGQPVEIDAITTGWDGWNPKLGLAGVRVLDRPARRPRRCSTCRRST